MSLVWGVGPTAVGCLPLPALQREGPPRGETRPVVGQPHHSWHAPGRVTVGVGEAPTRRGEQGCGTDPPGRTAVDCRGPPGRGCRLRFAAWSGAPSVAGGIAVHCPGVPCVPFGPRGLFGVVAPCGCLGFSIVVGLFEGGRGGEVSGVFRQVSAVRWVCVTSPPTGEVVGEGVVCR